MAVSLDKIGHIVSVSVDRFSAQLNPETSLSPGAFLKVPQKSRPSVIAIVSSVELRGEELYASLVPIGEMGGRKFRRGVRYYPKPKAEVVPVERSDLESIYQTWAQMGYKVGRLSEAHDIEIYLHPSLLFSRHFTIVGQSGSGKSWTVTNLVQRILPAMPNAKVIFLDLQGEYGWRKANGEVVVAFPEGCCHYLDGQSLELPYWLLTYEELASLLIAPESEHREIQRTFLHQVLTELRTREGRRLGIAYPSIDAPLYFSIEELYQRIKKENEARLDFGKRFGPFYGKFVDLLVRFEGFLSDSRYRFLFCPKRYTASESLPKLLEELTGIGTEAAITLIGVSDLPFEVRPLVCAQIARLLYEFNFWNPSRRAIPLLLLCEEAHNYLNPRGGSGSTLCAFERIAKEGRKYGVGLGVITQRPREISETILAQCGTFFCLRLSNPDDQNYVARLLTGAERYLIDMLPALGPGEGLVVGDAVPMPLRVQFFRPEPPPKSSDADYCLAWRLTPKGVPVDKIVSKWQRQGN